MEAQGPITYRENLYRLSSAIVDQFLAEVALLGPLRNIRLKANVRQEAFGSLVHIYWIPRQQFCPCSDVNCPDAKYILKGTFCKVKDDFGLEALKHSLAKEYEWCLNYR